MIFETPTCPECGLPAYGTVEHIPGVALLAEDATPGTDVEWAGETKVEWDGQTTESDAEGRVLLTCRSGHEWWSKVKEAA